MKNERNPLFWIILLILFSFITGYFTKGIVTESKVYNLPDTINVTGVTFCLDKTKLLCNFVPETYSDQITYKVNVIDNSDNSQKIYEANVKNGIGSITASVENAHTYRFVLIIDNKVETRNITIADEVFINLKDNSISAR